MPEPLNLTHGDPGRIRATLESNLPGHAILTIPETAPRPLGTDRDRRCLILDPAEWGPYCPSCQAHVGGAS